MTKTSLIIGGNGQDGKILAEQLRKTGHRVVVWARDEIFGLQIDFPSPCLEDSQWVANFINEIQPTYVFYLAAVHHSAEDGLDVESAAFSSMLNTNTLGLVNILDGIRLYSPSARLFYAASAHIFGIPKSYPQNEETSIEPTTPYGISKSAGLFVCRRFRREYGLYAVAGILYSHESSLRDLSFLSAKIARSVAEIKFGLRDKLIIGSLDAIADWGYAPDYTRAMTLMLEQDVPRDFIVATGEAHTVGEFAKIAFDSVGLEYQNYIKTDASILRRYHGVLIGDSTRLKLATEWSPSIGFEEMVKRLVDEQVKNISQDINLKNI